MIDNTQREREKMARLEGFERGVLTMAELITGKKPTEPQQRRNRPGRPFGWRKKPTQSQTEAGLPTPIRKRTA